MKRRVLVGAIGLVATVVTATGLAWACTIQPLMYLDSPPVGGSGISQPVPNAGTLTVPPGASVRVNVLNGSSAYANGAEIRWNGVDGALLATAHGRNFSVPVQVPADARPDVYYLVALGRNADGTVDGKVATTVQVTAPGNSLQAASSNAWARAGLPVSTAGRSGSQSLTVVLGIGLLSVGLVSLFGAFALMSVRRRALAATRRT